MTSEPEYRRVAAEIRDRIRQGRGLTNHQRGRKLPTLETLIKEHSTSYGTLRTVLLVLEAEGWIVRRGGVGVFVREDHPSG